MPDQSRHRDEPAEDDLQRVYRIHRQYNGLQRWWYGWHYIPGVVGIAGGIIAGVAEIPDFGFNWIFGVVASIMTGIVTFLGPLPQAEKYKRAYAILDKALLKYQLGLLDGDEKSARRYIYTKYTIARGLVLTGDGVTEEDDPAPSAS